MVLTLVSTLSCFDLLQIKKDKSPVVARVNKSKLTLRDLNKSIPASYSGRVTRKQRLNFVKQWMDTELLYQSALKNKLDKKKEIKNRLDKMKRDLLSAEMLNNITSDLQTPQITENDIRTYYENHKESFVRENDIVKYVEIVTENLRTGWKVRNLVKKDNFMELAKNYSIEATQSPKLAKFVAVNELPKELGAIIFGIRVGGTTSPIKYDNKVHIVRLLDKRSAGEISQLDEVRESIVSTLISQKRIEQINLRMANLRNGSDYEFNAAVIADDSLGVSVPTEELNNEDTLTRGKDVYENIY